MKTLTFIFLTLFIAASSVFATDPPTENQGRNAIGFKIFRESKGLLRMLKFTKTNGQKSLVNGVEMYTMECSVEVTANEDCALTGFEFGGGWNGSFAALKAQKKAGSLDTFNPFGAAYGTNKQLAKGAHMTFNTNLVFDLTERGWRTGDFLPADTPELPAPASPAPESRKPNPLTKKIIGKWQGSRHVGYYAADGGFALDPQPGDKLPGRWYLDGDKLHTDYGGSDSALTVISVTDSELVVKDERGNTYKHKRVSE